MLKRLSTLVTGTRSRWLVLGAWVLLAVALAPLQPRLQDEAANENEAFLADSAESTLAGDLVDERFATGPGATAIVAYHRPGGLTEQDFLQIDAEAQAICDSRAVPGLRAVVTSDRLACGELDTSLAPETMPARVSDDRSTALVTVDVAREDTPSVVAAVEALRGLVADPGSAGLRAHVTGEAGITADSSAAYDGIDRTLLAITMGLVLILLLAIYRSPVIALVPLLAVGAAYLIAAGAAYGLVSAGALDVTGQATAILIVLMFGAGTDYCLLLVARAREELQRTSDPRAAIAAAVERSGPAILSAGATVVAAMLVLTLADFRATRGMGPVLAIGVAVTVLAGLTLLPAALAALGRRAFWPAVPRAGAEPRRRLDPWARVGRLIRARPALIAATAAAVLLAGALGNLPDRPALAVTDSFRDPPESVRGLELVRSEFGAGRAAPLTLVVENRNAPAVVAAVGRHDAVETTTALGLSRDQTLATVDVQLAVDPFSEAALDAVPELRDAIAGAAAGGTALLGGAAAEAHDSRAAQRADAALIAPLTLLLILLVVAALVRALVAPLYLVATVVLSYAFALGVSFLLFTHVLGQPASDPALPLFAFIFLVALGVDYNIFLIGRIREERARLDSRAAAIAGLRRTGGVITSAGLILAGTFAALIALPVEGMAQVGFAIALGLLVDTFLVRVFLVPAIAVLLGEKSWWPAAHRGSAVKVLRFEKSSLIGEFHGRRQRDA